MQSILIVYRDWAEGKWGMTSNSYQVSFGGYEIILELDSDNGCSLLKIF